MELKEIKGIGIKTLEHLKVEGITSLDDLFFTLPKKYTIYETHNENLFSGEFVCIDCYVNSSPIFLKYRRNINTIIFYVWVENTKVKCVCFSSDYLRYKLFKGTRVVLYGRYKKENKEFLVQNVFFEPFQVKIELDYKLKNISNSLMTKAIKNAFQIDYIFNDNLPTELIEKYKLYPLNKYIYACHFPQNKNDYIQVLRRRKYEEFFWYSVSLELLKTTRKTNIKLNRNIEKNKIESFINQLTFELTLDQKNTIYTILEDISLDYPMNRLVQGDVGCGKSIVAYLAAYMEVISGFQVVIMVPTEMLAVQQYENIKKLFNGYNISIELLTSSIKNKDKADILYRLANHRINIIVGTHALIEENVLFHKLGLVVIDEQHRFGVMQRSKLISKFPGVDCLYLTATPIPRTLGLTSFGDLDISSIHTLPKNRKAIKTFVYNYQELYQFIPIIKEHIANKEQVYIVVPLVEKNEDIDAMDIYSAYEYFKDVLPDVSIGVVHGKMKAIEKNQIMQDFKYGKLNVLLATTVIEVGVDVKNATIMIILDANRYGLAQIHQLRGRVGRGDRQSYCYLISKVFNERLEILKNCYDGFEIAMEDFKLRGPGDYLGEDQSGFNGLNYVDFENDFKIWTCAKEDGQIYCRKFLKEKSKNKKFLELMHFNQGQKTKIN